MKAYSPVKGSKPYKTPTSSITVCRSQYMVSSKTSCIEGGGCGFHASAEGKTIGQQTAALRTHLVPLIKVVMLCHSTFQEASCPAEGILRPFALHWLC